MSFVEVKIDPISGIANNDSTQMSRLCLTIVRAFKCVCVEMLGTSSLSCVAHWPRFQLFSAWDNGRNGFITEHNTWVLFSTIVFKVLVMAWFGAVHCVHYPLWTHSQQWATSLQSPTNNSPAVAATDGHSVTSSYPLGSTNGVKIILFFFILSHFRSF